MNRIKRLLSSILYKIIHSTEYENIILWRKARLNSELSQQFKKIGHNSLLPIDCIIKNPQYISIGEGFAAMYNLRIEAWDEYREQKFSPEIIIGNNVIVNTDVHIGCINKVVIGNGVLMASRIYISDHSHGHIGESELVIPPTERKLFSKGPIIIKDNVWIGEGVCIMPGVTIGENSIIGANAVVTKDVPPNVVAAGIPAKIIKQFKIDN